MRIGIDLDNTLVCYDQLFWRLATERGWISPRLPPRKDRVRDELRRLGREEDWILLQGEVYGVRMVDAAPFPDALQAVRQLRKRRGTVYIVSHRTPTPIAGPPYDLHAAARSWLERRGFLDVITGLSPEHVFLETSKQNKLARIEELGLTWFIDDLPELLLEPAFPAGVRRVLFDPHRHRPALPPSINAVHDWNEVVELLSEKATS
jgi:FMN phosphatase YigB (HAD superfamily)